MCQESRGRGAAYAEGLAHAVAGRRTLLKVGGAAGAGLVFSSALRSAQAAPAPQTTPLRAYVLVLDGIRPDEIEPTVMPNVAALRAGGLDYPGAQSLPVMETLPNHVMMMTGVRPDRSGVPANAIYDRALGVVREMDQPTDIQAPTVLGQLQQRGLASGTVLSKEYLYGIFGTRATHRWEPAPLLPVTGHAPDVFTMDAAVGMLTELDPHLMFVNLGDIDRFGHGDLTGPLDLKAARRLALASTDQQVARFVAALRDSGRWEHSMLVVLADHSMDWSHPDRTASLTAPLAADPLLAGRVQVAQNGGAELLYWTGPGALRAQAVERMRSIALGTEGVLAAYDVAATEWLRLGPEAGDVLVYCRAGWRFTDPDVLSNPIPGNHGHPATRPIPFFLAGGHPRVGTGSSSARAQTVDVAPTVADFFGLSTPAGRYDGVSRLPG